MQREYIVDISDTHANHKLALCNPDVILHDEAPNGTLIPVKPKLTTTQEYLWELLQSHKQTIIQKIGDDPLTLIHNGELCWGGKYPYSIMSTRMADQISIGLANLQVWYEIPNLKTVRIVAGNNAHDYGEASTEILICDRLKSLYPDIDTQFLYHGLAHIGGLLVDYAHVGPPPGKRAWLTGNEARYYLRSIMEKSLMAGKQPPDLVLRAHYHEWVCETVHISVADKDYFSTLIVTPSYMMITDYARYSGKSPDTITNGLVLIEIVDGMRRIMRLTKTLDIRTKEEL
jgi:hypothetical protein